MDRRWNLLFAIPLLAALVVFLLTEQLAFTALAFVGGYVLMEGLRFLVLPPHLHRAVQNYRRGDLEEALALTEMSIEKRPDRWESHYLRSLIYFAMSRLDLAEQSIREAIRLNEDSDTSYNMLGQILYSQNQLEEAEQNFAKAVELRAREGLNHYHLGATQYRLERYADAAPRLELATRLGIDNPQLNLLAHYYLARSHEQLGQQEEAESAYDKMQENREAFEALKQDVASVPDYPALPQLKQEVAAINSRLRWNG
jgi:tetratricopeptide (TPR) repeat protein